MRKRKYSKEQIDFVANLVSNPDKPIKVTPATIIMCAHFDLPYREGIGRTFRDILQKKGVTKGDLKLEDSKAFKKASKKKFDKRRKNFSIAWAQNNTRVHEKLLINIEAYSNFHKAGIHVIAGRYKNPTSIWSYSQRSEEFWANEVLPYLDANRHNLHKYLQVLSDVKVQPTAATPLSGFNGITGLESCIIGHPRIHLMSLPILDGYPHKVLATTGAVTVENYTDSKAGKKGNFHHQLGFIFVELSGEDFYMRQISAASDGSFYDLNYFVKDGVVYENDEGVEAIILGDIHNLNTDPIAMKATEKMLDSFKPSHTIIHDLFDGERINPHARKDPFAVLRQEETKTTLQDEIDLTIKWLEKYKEHNLVVTRGNHDIFFDRFLMEDWRKLPDKKTYLKYANILSEGIAPNGVIPYIIDNHFNGDVRALGLDDSYRVLDWELAVHGHIGANGSRGSAIQFKNLNTKTVTGHTHTPVRLDGHLAVGTLTKIRMDYVKGMSSWMHSNVVIYPNGKAQHLHIINGKFTNFKLKPW